ncbi:MAG: hypothetical protein H6843_13495 [Rhodospirillaceae bacterium]|nr:hypothetical protein [Rhodospirillaceae bacterium]
MGGRLSLVGAAALALAACQTTTGEAGGAPTRLATVPETATAIAAADAAAALAGHAFEGVGPDGTPYFGRYEPDGTGTLYWPDGETYPVGWRIDGDLFCESYQTEECGSTFRVDDWYVSAADGTVISQQRPVAASALPEWAAAAAEP